MKKKICGLLGALVLVISITAQGESPPVSDNVSLKSLVEEALANNLKIKAAEKRWMAELERIPQAKALPDPMLSYGHFFQSIETRLGPQRNKFSLSQRFPFFGKLSLKGKIAAGQAAVVAEQLNRIKWDVTLSVKEAFYGLMWFDEAIAISRREMGVLSRLADVALKKYAAGSASQQDSLKAHLEITRLTEKIMGLEQGRRAAVDRLNAVLSRPLGTEFPPVVFSSPYPLDADLGRMLDWGRKERPELKATQEVISRDGFSLQLARKNYIPDFNIMLDYFDVGGGSTSLSDDGRNAWMASIGINIPLWRGKLRASEAEAAIRLKSSQDVLTDLQNDTAAWIRELYHAIKTYDEQLQLYTSALIPQSEQSLKAAEVGYTAGRIDFINILDAERVLLQLRTGYAKLLTDREKSLARLERVVGRDLKSLNAALTPAPEGSPENQDH